MRKVFLCREYSRVAFKVLKVFVLVFVAMSCAQNSSAYNLGSQSADVRAQIPNAPYRWFASTDPKSRNADYLLLKPGETRRIPLTSGALLRLWSTSSAPEKTTLFLQNKKRMTLWQNGKARVGESYEKAFTLYPMETATSLRVLASDAALIAINNANTETKFFYQVAIAPLVKTPTRLGRLPYKSGYDEKNITLPPKRESEFWRAEKSGAIQNIQIQIAGTLDDWNDVRLRATWGENEKENAVDIPLGAFAANFYSDFSSQSALWRFDGQTLILRAEMPFEKGARLSLLNTKGQILNASTRIVSHSSNSASSLRFCARFGTAKTQRGKPLEILAAQGGGAFLGFSLGVKPLPSSARRAFAYLEGNETIEADGRSYEGTGTEDFFDSAWYFPQKPFARPLHGFTFRQNIPPQFSAYRLMIPDAVPFAKSLRVSLEHGNGNNTDDLQYSWVAYWYQKAPLSFSIEEAALQIVKAEDISKENSSNGTVAAGLAVVLGSIATLIFRRRRMKDEKK
jgi:hypothetical protein